MGLYNTFRALRKLIRALKNTEQTHHIRQEHIIPQTPALNSDAECIAVIRRYMDYEDLALRAVAKIKSPMRIATLALDPDIQPYIRIAALARLGSDDDMRIRIARGDHDPAVAISALQTLVDKRRIKEAIDSKHDVVKLYATTPSLE